MRIVVSDYEQGKDYTLYRELIQEINASRIMFDIMIEEAVSKDLVSLDREGDLLLTSQGKYFAIEHGLVRK